ncbi:1-phosphatidylinositol 4 [Diplonema papillatum]|nr:1-phosphatidylinositol 4 [Diplonema papillatum]KAJ9465955.1 1-phosphatidylinositol 4 [Diplonema papillatum]KAJ9465956.1 1-phosphatidylinositol 4 [Diplonema papillatum]
MSTDPLLTHHHGHSEARGGGKAFMNNRPNNGIVPLLHTHGSAYLGRSHTFSGSATMPLLEQPRGTSPPLATLESLVQLVPTNGAKVHRDTPPSTAASTPRAKSPDSLRMKLRGSLSSNCLTATLRARFSGEAPQANPVARSPRRHLPHDYLVDAFKAVEDRDALSLHSSLDADEMSVSLSDGSSDSPRAESVRLLEDIQESAMLANTCKPLRRTRRRDVASMLRTPSTAPLNSTVQVQNDPSSHHWGHSISPVILADRLINRLMCGCCRHAKSTGTTYAELQAMSSREESLTNVPITALTLQLVAFARNIFHSVLKPGMSKANMAGLALQLQAALLFYKAMPPAHRFDILLRAVPEWGVDMKEVIGELRAKYAFREPKIKAGMLQTARVFELFWHCDKEGTGQLDIGRLKSLVKLLNLSITRRALEELFDQHDVNHDGYIEFNEFAVLYDSLSDRPELRPLYCEVAGAGEVALSTAQFLEFLSNEQHDEISFSRAKTIMLEWKGASADFGARAFARYLTSTDNSWWEFHKGEVYQDMTQPLPHYFVNSSHNTYLSGDQLKSTSSHLMYKYALLRGCRCLEIDIWDGKDGRPVVTHGHTGTTRIQLADVLKTINDYAFTASEYPIVLSLEVHASPSQQEVVASLMKGTFGKRLHPPVAFTHLSLTDARFTPESLRNRILIKGSMMPPRRALRLSLREDDMHEMPEDDYVPEGERVIQRPIARELSDLVYLKTKRTKSSDPTDVMYTCEPCDIMSLPEVKAERLLGHDMVEMNKKMFTRIYPRGARVDSSNFDPQPYWASGCQFVALNVQTPDHPVRVNQAKFSDNGGAGWLLKPEWLRQQNASLKHVPNVTVIDVLVVSAGNLPRCRKQMDPQIEGFVSGVPGDDTSQTPVTTSAVERNGFNPVWQELLQFRVRIRELALITLRVVNKRTKGFVAEASVPVDAMRAGHRSVPLCDAHGRSIQGCFLLCHISFSEAPASEEPGSPRVSFKKKTFAGMW